ncbi:MAG: hypothetical protein QOF60_2820 [Actinomycetota bacterium]|jgi:hypothetical protein|nr:hypothetical protein [Actinomycetota bacterium]
MSPDLNRIWAAEREARKLQRGHASFATSGLMTHLDEPRLLAVVLPADPLAVAVDFDDRLLEALPQRFIGRTSNGVEVLGSNLVTDDALGRFARSERGWRAYVAMRRNGATEVGMGSTIRYRERKDDGPFVYRLYYIVHAVRVIIESQARLLAALRWSGEGPFEVVLGIGETGGSQIGGLNDGWSGPESWFDDGPTCLTPDVLVRSEVAVWPMEADGQTALMTSISDRVCNAWGTTQRLFAPPNGRPGAGLLSSGYA